MGEVENFEKKRAEKWHAKHGFGPKIFSMARPAPPAEGADLELQRKEAECIQAYHAPSDLLVFAFLHQDETIESLVEQIGDHIHEKYWLRE